MENSINEMIQKGLKALKQGNSLVALMEFENAAKIESSPLVMACYGYCIALERDQYRKGLELCMQAAEKEPGNSKIWLMFGRTCVLAGKKPAAFKAFRRGLKLGRNPEITTELKNLGQRKEPVIESLDREHPVNRYLGILFSKLGFR